MSQHQTILRMLIECVPVALFTGTRVTPAFDLLPDLAQHLCSMFEHRLDPDARKEGLAHLITLGSRTDVVSHYFRNQVLPDRVHFLPERRQRAFLQALVAGLCRFSSPPQNRMDWLAVLPPAGVLSSPRDLESDVQPFALWQTGYRRQTWTAQEGTDPMLRLVHGLFNSNVDGLLRRAERLNHQTLARSPQVWLLDGSVTDIPLTRRIREQGKEHGTGVRETLALIQACARAVAGLHLRGFAHGDLRPACLVTLPDDRVELRGCVESVLVQAALRRQRESPGRCILLHEAVQGEGSLFYASPQVQRGLEATPTDDVYSLATIAYQILLGDLLAGRPGGSAWRDELRDRQVPPWLIDLLEVCWSDTPEDRPADGADLEEQMECHLAGSRLVLLEGPLLESFTNAAGYLRKAEAELERGEPGLALLYVERALRFGPSLTAFQALARTHFHLEQYGQVVEDCVAILQRDPTQHPERALLGAAYSKLGRHAEAISELTQAIPLLPPEARWFALRSRSLLALNRRSEAWADCEEALALGPRDLVALCVRGEIHRLEQRYREAIEDCTLALDCVPDLVAARRTRAQARAAFGDYTGALNDFDEELRQKPGDVELLLSRAEMYRDWQHFPEALRDYKQVLSQVPDHPIAQAGLKRCQAEGGG